jgi:hypothetical protein
MAKLKWYFQFTPHDLHDWDGQQTPMVVYHRYWGEDRKLLIQPNRNGFFYVLDRTNGKMLLAEKFFDTLNWASGIDKNGRPIRLPGADPTLAGVKSCPSQAGATNWMSTAFNPSTGFFYLMALEACEVSAKDGSDWEPRALLMSIPGAVVATVPAQDAPQRAPNFWAKSLGGDRHTNDSLKGKVVLVQFWTTWCQYCRRDQPSVESVTEEFKDRAWSCWPWMSANRRRRSVSIWRIRLALAKSCSWRTPTLLPCSPPALTRSTW